MHTYETLQAAFSDSGVLANSNSRKQKLVLRFGSVN
jgi:hypothetical protein